MVKMAFHPREIWPIAKETVSVFLDDKALRLSAALAYYTTFSLAPLLVLSVTMLGAVMKDARGAVIGQLQLLMGETGKNVAVQVIDNANNTGSGTLATVVSVLLLLIGASGVFGELQDSMNTIWKVEARPGKGILTYLRNRFLSLAMVFGIVFLLMASLVISAVLTAVTKHVSGSTQLISHVLDLSVSIIVIAVLVASIFKFLPDAVVRWRDVWPAAVLTSILFTLGKIGLGIYLGVSTTASAYGAAGSLAALLIWLYYSSAIMFFGAEFAKVNAKFRGQPIQPVAQAEIATPKKIDQPVKAPLKV